jgi:hypothetical protein
MCLKLKNSLQNPYDLLDCIQPVSPRPQKVQQLNHTRGQSCKVEPFYVSQRVMSEQPLFAKGHLELSGGQHIVSWLCCLPLGKFSFPVVCRLLKCEVTNTKQLKSSIKNGHNEEISICIFVTSMGK